MDSGRLERLFKQYEKDFDKLDMKAISNYYADTFISAGPKGTITQSKKEFEEKGEQAVAFYRSVGQKSARIISKRTMPISNEYTMVVVRWGVIFEKTGAKPIEFDVTYIVQDISSPQIILFISHEDEEAAMKKLGLQPAMKK
jgi:hypothetical protein